MLKELLCPSSDLTKDRGVRRYPKRNVWNNFQVLPTPSRRAWCPLKEIIWGPCRGLLENQVEIDWGYLNLGR